jgi:hypothetical protein
MKNAIPTGPIGKVEVSDALAQSIFLLRLEAKPGTNPAKAIHRLRAFLKISKRRFGFRCTSARESAATMKIAEPPCFGETVSHFANTHDEPPPASRDLTGGITRIK